MTGPRRPARPHGARLSLTARLVALVRKPPRLATPTLIAAVSVFNAAVYHAPLLAFANVRLDSHSGAGLLTLATLLVLVSVATAAVLAAICLVSQRLLKPVCIGAAFLNAVALYFMQGYGVVLDKSMMGNVLNTNFAEAADLWHPRLGLYLLVFGLAPSLVLWWIGVRAIARTRLVAFAVVLVAGCLAWLYAASSTWLWIDKHARALGGLILPWSYTVNAVRYQSSKWAAARQATLLPDAHFIGDAKVVVVLVIGESARASNFSMYGYARRTNPELSAAGAVALPNTQACATYTTQALMCILSHDDPGLRLAGSVELLPSYLQRHGVEVIWRSNNWGEPPLRVSSYERAEQIQKTCIGERCSHDELLLDGLANRIRTAKARKVLVVLHQSGSHGPSYSTKYPPGFEMFHPVCNSVDLSQCSSQALLNTYDNTIFYTDHVVGRAIGILEELPDVPSTLLYISDHGESLGEHGLYLHGTPKAIAPDVQTQIPFIVWMSEAFKRQMGTDEAQLARGLAHSQANVFHSVMGAVQMRSQVYAPRLDVFGSPPLKGAPR